MTKFTAASWFEIKGVGWEAAVSLDRDSEDLSHLTGQPVVIDGNTYQCLSVNHFRRSPPWRKGERIGIVVKQRHAALTAM